MNALIIDELDGLWSLREGHATFPIFEGKPALVIAYIRRHFCEHGSVEIRKGGGVSQQTHVQFLTEPQRQTPG